MKKLSPFDFVKAINEKTGNPMDTVPESEKQYLPFMVNRSLSFSPDTILYANEMNCQYMLDNRMQFDYLYHSVRRRKRFDKWIKKEESVEQDITAIMNHYKVSRRKAREYMSLLSEEQITALKGSRGGSNAK
jgi:hypothetical protein